MESAFLPILFSFWKKYRGALHLYYTKEGKIDKQNITISSYARDIANEVFIRLNDESFMTKVHERMEMEEKEKTKESSEMVDTITDENKEMINVMVMNNAVCNPSIGAT